MKNNSYLPEGRKDKSPREYCARRRDYWWDWYARYLNARKRGAAIQRRQPQQPIVTWRTSFTFLPDNAGERRCIRVSRPLSVGGGLIRMLSGDSRSRGVLTMRKSADPVVCLSARLRLRTIMGRGTVKILDPC